MRGGVFFVRDTIAFNENVYALMAAAVLSSSHLLSVI